MRQLSTFLFFAISSFFWGVANASQVTLTQLEINFLEQTPVISIGGNLDWAPYVMTSSSGEITGFDHAVLQLVNEKTGANFQIIGGIWADIVAQAQARKIDGLTTSAVSAQRSEYFDFSVPYFVVPKLLLVSEGKRLSVKAVFNTEECRIGYIEANENDRQLLSRYPSCKNRTYRNVKALVDGLINNEVDAIIESHTVFDAEPARAALLETLEVIPDGDLELVFSLRKDYSEALSILNKGLMAISAQERLRLTNAWFQNYQLLQPFEDSIRLDFTKEEQDFLTSKDVIRVGGMSDFVPFNYVVDGLPAGYSVEYMNLLITLLGKDIEWVHEPLGPLLNQLEQGQIDVFPHLAITKERIPRFDYSEFEHVSFYIGLLSDRSGNFTHINDLNGHTLAVVNSYFLYEYLRKEHPNINLLITSSTEASVAAVLNGRADAAIDNIPTFNYLIKESWLTNLSVNTIDGLQLDLKADLHMAVPKGERIWLSILEKAQANMPADKVLELRKTWIFDEEPMDRLALTDVEKKFLAMHPVIRFRIRPDRPPFEFVEDNQAEGIAVDYIRAIAEAMDFTAEFVVNNMAPEEAYIEMESSRELFDTLAYSVKNPSRERRFSFGDVYMNYPMMIIGHSGTALINGMSDLRNMTVVLETGFLTNDWIRRDYPHINIINAPTTFKALEIVHNGGADAYVGNLAVANYLMNFGGLDNLKVLAPSDYGEISYNFIAPKEWPELASILSKGYQSLPLSQHSSIQQKWFSLRIVKTIDYALVRNILIIGFFTIFFIVLWNRRLASERKETERALAALQIVQGKLETTNAELARVSVTDKLTNLYNRSKLDGLLANELARSKRYKSIMSIALIDVDYFKRVNDTYGHLAGDEVLKLLSKLLLENIRDVDIVGRWGGEEFLVICPSTDQTGLMAMAEKLLQTISQTNFPMVGQVTISVGTATIEPSDTNFTLLKRADDALYRAKEAGRNRVSD